MLAARAAYHGPLASSATHTGDDRPVALDLSLPGENAEVTA